jgi:hypothetical protein
MKKTSKVKSGGVRSEGVKSPTPTLTHSPTHPLPHSAVANPQQLVDQYQVVIAAEKTCFRERVKFGAMLIQWERHLGEARGGAGGTSNGGLKDWLAENCPELSYATAMEYKVYAEKVLTMLGGSASAVAALLGNETVVQPDGEVVDVDGEVVERCDTLFEDVTSRRKLEQTWFAFMGREATAKKPAAKTAIPMRSAQENAKTIWTRVLPALSSKTLSAAIALLPAKETEVCWGIVKDLYDALKAHRAELNG